MREYSLELGAIELLQEASRHRDRRVPRIATCRERVRRGVLDEEDPRLGQTIPDRQRLHHMVQLGLLLLAHLASLRHPENERVAGVVRGDRRERRDAEREGKDEEAAGAPATPDVTEEISEGGDEGDEHGDEKEGLAAVRVRRVVHREPWLHEATRT